MSTWIKGIGGYLPERVVTSEELEEMAGYKDHGVKIGLCKMLTGCASRHWAAKDELCSDIAARAGEIAMKEAGVEPQDVDAHPVHLGDPRFRGTGHRQRGGRQTEHPQRLCV